MIQGDGAEAEVLKLATCRTDLIAEMKGQIVGAANPFESMPIASLAPSPCIPQVPPFSAVLTEHQTNNVLTVDKSSPLNYDSYSPVPNEGRKSSNSFRSREIEFAWSDIRADPLNPKPTVSSSIRRQSSDSLAMPSIVQELTQYADAITKNASIKIRLDLKNEEVKQQECPNRRLAKHKKEWQPIGESMDCAAGAVAKDASRLADHQAKSNMAQAEMTKKLAVKLQRAESSASLPSSNAATISEKEFLDLKKELRDTKSALLDVQETMDSIRRHAIMERDLDNRGYVDKEQIRKIKTDENVGLENKVATLLVDMSKHYDNEARERKKIETIISSLQTFQSEQSSRNTTQMAAAKALSNMVIGKLDGHAKNMEEFRSSMVADQDTKINAYLNQHLQDYKATKSDLETRFGTAMAEMQQLKDAQAEIVQRQTAHAEAAQAQAAQAHDQVQAACTEEGHASVTDLGSNISESAINAMIWEIVDKEMLKQKEDQEEHQETLLELTANLEKKVAGLEQQQVRHGTLTNEIDGLRLAVDSMIRSYNSQSQNMAVFQHPGLQRPRQPVPSQPPTPPTTNVGLGDLNVMGEALFQRLKDLENRQIQLDIRQDQTQTFVRSQQQKFDNLTSTQLAQNMVDHLSRVYPYHPANTIGQIQNLNSCQKQMDTAIRHHALKLKSLDVEPITQIISDYPTCKRLASDAFRLVNQHQGHLTTLESKFPSQLQDAEKGILAKLNDEHDNSVAALTSVHTRMDEIVESFKTETITRTEELAKVKKDIDYFRKLEELMRTKQNLVSNPCDSDTEAETPLLEERSRHGTTISTSSASSKKRTPETSLGEDESDDEDAIIAHPNKRRRSNKPSEQKRHGVSKS